MKLLHDSSRYAVKSFAFDTAYLVINKVTGAETVYWGDDATLFETRWRAQPCAEARAAREAAGSQIDAMLTALWPISEHNAESTPCDA